MVFWLIYTTFAAKRIENKETTLIILGNNEKDFNNGSSRHDDYSKC